MIKSNQNVELFLSTFFFLSEDDAKKLANIFSEARSINNVSDVNIATMLKKFEDIKLDENNLLSESLEKILLITFAEEFILRNIHHILMDEETSKKLEAVVKRKQIESKVLKEFKSYLVFIISRLDDSISSVLEFIYFSMKPRLDKYIEELENEMILTKYKGFKDSIEEICPGISNSVYMNLNDIFSIYDGKDILDKVNNYFIKKYNYDYCKANNYYDYLNKNNFIYSEYILLNHLNDYETISLGHHRRSLMNLFSVISKYNSFTYVEKIIDSLMDNIKCEYPDYELIINNNLPLHLLDSEYYVDKSKQTFKDHFKIFKQYDLNVISKYENSMLLLDGENNAVINKGKVLLTTIINEVYPSDFEKVMNLFNNPKTNIIYTPYQFNNASKIDLTFGEYLDYVFCGTRKYGGEVKFLELKYDYFSEENTLNRLYYIVFILNELDSKSINSMFHTLYGRILMQQGFESKYQLDTSKRDEKYNDLKKVLIDYNLELSDNYKELYISALLDEKVATFEEVEIYKQLEQKGDAIYQLACNEVLFYNKDTDNYTYNDVDNMIKAESQIEVAKKLNLDKLYITNYSIDETSELIDSQVSYLADSLEMIIGAISIEFGVNAALSFTHKLLESKLDKISEYEFEDNKDYHTKCFPSCNEIDIHFDYYGKLDKALVKFVLSYCYGNQNIENRNKIRDYHSLYNILYKEGEVEYVLTHILIKEYLHSGINFIFNKYKDKIVLK